MALTEPAVTWQTCGGGFAMNDIASLPLLDGTDLDAAIDHARTALAALLRVPGGGDGAGHLKMLAEARALLGALGGCPSGGGMRRPAPSCRSSTCCRRR